MLATIGCVALHGSRGSRPSVGTSTTVCDQPRSCWGYSYAGFSWADVPVHPVPLVPLAGRETGSAGGLRGSVSLRRESGGEHPGHSRTAETNTASRRRVGARASSSSRRGVHAALRRGHCSPRSPSTSVVTARIARIREPASGSLLSGASRRHARSTTCGSPLWCGGCGADAVVRRLWCGRCGAAAVVRRLWCATALWPSASALREGPRCAPRLLTR